VFVSANLAAGYEHDKAIIDRWSVRSNREPCCQVLSTRAAAITIVHSALVVIS
jgi:hypothetical protein